MLSSSSKLVSIFIEKSLTQLNDQLKDDVIYVCWNEKYEDGKKVNYDIIKSF